MNISNLSKPDYAVNYVDNCFKSDFPAHNILSSLAAQFWNKCLRRWFNIEPMSVFAGPLLCGLQTRCWFCYHIPPNTIGWPSIGVMVAHHLRRWANIDPMLGPRIVVCWDGSIVYDELLCADWHFPIKHESLIQCCFNVGPPSTTLAQH